MLKLLSMLQPASTPTGEPQHSRPDIVQESLLQKAQKTTEQPS